MSPDPDFLDPLVAPPTPSDRRRALTLTTISGLAMLGLSPIALVAVSGLLAGLLLSLALIDFGVAYLLQRGLENDRWRTRATAEIDVESEPVIDLGLRSLPAPVDLPVGPGRVGFEAVEALLEEHGEHFE